MLIFSGCSDVIFESTQNASETEWTYSLWIYSDLPCIILCVKLTIYSLFTGYYKEELEICRDVYIRVGVQEFLIDISKYRQKSRNGSFSMSCWWISTFPSANPLSPRKKRNNVRIWGLTRLIIWLEIVTTFYSHINCSSENMFVRIYKKQNLS